jgi:hypothetical protein
MQRSWTELEIMKLRLIAGRRSLGQIAEELGRSPGSVEAKARVLKLSLSHLRRQEQQPASMDLKISGG